MHGIFGPHSQRPKIAPIPLSFPSLVRAQPVPDWPNGRGGIALQSPIRQESLQSFPAGSALASPNDQVVICTMLGVQVSSKAKHWSITFCGVKIDIESLSWSRLLVFLKSDIFADS